MTDSDGPINLLILGNIISVILSVVGIPLYIFHKKNDSNPSNYMKMGSDLIPLIKTKNSSWISYEGWMREITSRKYIATRSSELVIGNNIYFCPNCAFKNSVKTNFCTSCGFKLK